MSHPRVGHNGPHPAGTSRRAHLRQRRIGPVLRLTCGLTPRRTASPESWRGRPPIIGSVPLNGVLGRASGIATRRVVPAPTGLEHVQCSPENLDAVGEPEETGTGARIGSTATVIRNRRPRVTPRRSSRRATRTRRLACLATFVKASRPRSRRLPLQVPTAVGLPAHPDPREPTTSGRVPSPPVRVPRGRRSPGDTPAISWIPSITSCNPRTESPSRGRRR